MGSFVYVIFGSIAQVSIGPTSLMAILTLQFTSHLSVQFVIALAFLAGVVELLMGIFKLGFLVNFISSPVTSAFTTATSIIVIGAQMRNLLGIPKGMFKSYKDIPAMFEKIRPGDATLGLTCIAVLLCLRQLSYLNFSPKRQVIKKVLWYISISRNAIVVCIASFMAFHWVQSESEAAVPFRLNAKVNSSVPTFKLPPFSIDFNDMTYGFVDICSELGSAIIVVPLVAVLANVAIAKAFAKDGNLDATQEMFAMGLCNIFGSFFSAMPTCGAFTRSAVSNASGVRTPMAGIYSGTMVLFALGLFTKYFQYIPKSTLSAVLISAVLFMTDFKIVFDLWKNNKRDLLGWIGCFIASILYGVQGGLMVGILISMLFILLQLGSPDVQVNIKESEGIPYIHVSPDTDVFYTGIDHLRIQTKTACLSYDFKYTVVINASKFTQFDYTSISIVKTLAKELAEKNVILILQYMDEEAQKVLGGIENITFCDDIIPLGYLLAQKSRNSDHVQIKM
ncbi:hypothetical protein ACFFRR_007277 [Megaselia abdita]